jgi:asparagine synthase (glutamine-hydrolysing)
MCGICGIIRTTPEPVDREPLSRACAAMKHRGPDDTGIWTARSERVAAGLGVVRLAVLDPGPAASQPMHDPTGRYHLAYNGEVYNFRDLRREMSAGGDRFVTDSDTEVVLAAFARWGIDALNRFNGMWALAFYDSLNGTGFLARDRFGIKPLFHCEDAGRLYFASELPALLELGDWDRALDEHALVQHLRFGYIAHPATICRRARRLAPGCYLPFGPSGPSEPKPYYTPPIRGEVIGDDSYKEASGRVRRLLSDAVVRRRVSDVPIGVLLSGGLDSSIVVCHLAAATGQPVKTFAVGHADQPHYDETEYARLVADHFGTDHRELLLTRDDILAALPRVLDHLGEPVGDSSVIPTALICEFAARHVTVALSGDGGDELFGGYWRYLGHEAIRAYHRVPEPIRRLLLEPLFAGMSSSKSSGLGNRVRQYRKLLRGATEDPLARHLAWSRILAPEAEDLFLRSAETADCDRRTLERARELTADIESGDALDRILAFDLRYGLPADMLQKVDLASMMHSLEVRVPFLDPAVVEHALSCPARFKVRGGLRKRILTDAYRGHLPDPVLDRGKMGFEVPMGEHLRGPLRGLFRDVVNRRTIESFALLSYEAVERIYDEHRQRRAEHADLLFALLSLCWWRSRLS